MKTWVRQLLLTLGLLLGMVVLALVIVYIASEMRFRETYADVEPAPVEIPSDSASLAYGRHVAEIRACTECHGANLAGKAFMDDAVVARLYASNLTAGRGGVAGRYTDLDWVRAIRHGIGPDDRPLLFMPSHEYFRLSDRDLGSLIAYIKSVRPIDNVLSDNRVGPVGRLLYLAGDISLVPAELIDHDSGRVPAPEPGPTAEYGEYLAVGCAGCHGSGFSGGPIPGAPPEFPAASNLTPHPTAGIGRWTETHFFTALRSGRRPDGSTLDPASMPWEVTKKMTDEEILAVWKYLRTLDPKPFGYR